jgi:hypothetical protein
MSQREKAEEASARAAALEKKYDWLGASDLYKQALGAVDEEDFLKKVKIQEKIGFCFHMAALQADQQDAFDEYTRNAIKAYETASSAFASVGDPANQASGLRCKALALYCAQYLQKEHHEVRTGLYSVLELQKKAFELYKNCGDATGKIAQCRDVLQTILDLLNYEDSKDERVELVELGLTHDEEAVQICLDLNAERDLSDVYYKGSELYFIGSRILSDENRRVACVRKREEYIGNAQELADKTGDFITRVKATSSHFFWEIYWSAVEATPVYLQNVEDLLKECRKVRIREITTKVINCIMRFLQNQLLTATDRDKANDVLTKSKKYGDESARLNSVTGGIIKASSCLGLTFWNLGISYRNFGLLFENDPELRIRFLDKGIEIARKIPSHIPPSGWSPFLSTYSYHLNARASIERNPAHRKELLLEALEVADRWLILIENLFPYNYRGIAEHLFVYSSIRMKLAQMEAPNIRIKMLHEAYENSKNGIKYLNMIVQDKPLRITLAKSLSELGQIQYELSQATADHELLRESFLTFEKAAQTYSAEGLYVRTAETLWSLAKMQDSKGHYEKAAENFEQASENYRLMAVEIPNLKDFYQDYASYMRAWNNIVKAKQHHTEKQHGAAKEQYERAAELHKETKKWSYLSPNYLAWARLEEAEDTSRREQTPEAKNLFQQAAKLFTEAKESINSKLNSIEVGEERQIAEELIKASDVRQEYCLGRVALEEARILDRQGDHAVSSRKYGVATQRFLKVIDTVEQESERDELKPIIYLCQAWQKMMMAEARASSTLYGEAAEIFKQAKEYALDPPTSLLAQANSSFCEALQAGTEFEITRDTTTYSTAKKHMEAAANLYLRAGFKTASEYAKATYRLLDAYMYMYKAQMETDLGKRTRFYQVAEKFLQTSAGSYLKARHPEKSEEVRRVLEGVKEEREIAMSLSEVLHAPAIASTTSSFTTPTATHEQAVGLERFEHADIQSNLILRGREVKLGEDIDIEIELVNAGKAPAQLIKVMEIIPSGFEVRSAPDICRVEDSHLDMKGRTLNPLKTTELRLVLRPRDKGTYDVNPRILYLDGSGKYRSHEPDPVTVVIKEMGIKGWLRGPTR